MCGYDRPNMGECSSLWARLMPSMRENVGLYIQEEKKTDTSCSNLKHSLCDNEGLYVLGKKALQLPE